MELRNYNYLGTTQSLCPECLQLIPAKIIVRQGRVYFRKTCTTHGAREDFVCSDVNFYDRLEYTVPAKSPVEYGLAADRGCPYDCGLCDEHEQHTCIGLVELLGKADLHVTLANGLCFTRPQARDLILQYLGRQGCCRGQCAPGETGPAGGLPVMETGSDGCTETDANSQAFFDRVLAEQIRATDLFRITITSFLDAYNFDVRRLMKCCTHHILPSGHVIAMTPATAPTIVTQNATYPT